MADENPFADVKSCERDGRTGDAELARYEQAFGNRGVLAAERRKGKWLFTGLLPAK